MLELGGTFIPISFSCCVTCTLILSAVDLSHCDPIEEFIAPSPIPVIVVLLPLGAWGIFIVGVPATTRGSPPMSTDAPKLPTFIVSRVWAKFTALLRFRACCSASVGLSGSLTSGASGGGGIRDRIWAAQKPALPHLQRPTHLPQPWSLH